MQITPNRRLALFLQKSQKQHRSLKSQVVTRSISCCDEAQVKASSGAYNLVCEQRAELATKSQHERHRVYPLQTWIETLWQNLQEHLQASDETNRTPILLTSYEEELIWEKIISNSAAGQNILRVKPIAALAREANELIRQWNITSFSQFSDTEETQVFFEWWSAYKKVLSQESWLDRASLLEYITKNIALLLHNSNILPSTIQCVGFNEWTPQQTQFFACLQEKGIELSQKDLSVTPQSVVRASFPTAEDELHQAILMCRSWLQQNPQANIGLVVLDLEQRRDEIECMLQRLLPAGSFNVAAPIPLAKHPIIAAAFLGLSLTRQRIPLEDISRFLRSPFFLGGIEEQAWRAAIDVKLLRLKQSYYSCEEMISVLGSMLEEEQQEQNEQQEQKNLYRQNEATSQNSTNVLNALLNSLNSLSALKTNLRGKKTTTEWTENIKLILNSLGWGQGRSLNTNETLVQAEWEPLLETYQRIGKILGAHSFKQALHHIETLAHKTVFTPAIQNAQIHALGLLEAIGMPFDYLWCLGFSEKVWPKSPSPNPFIPLQLQCNLQLPRSHAQRELQKAKIYTDALCHGAKNKVIFSHPTMIEDRHLRISPLLKHLPEFTEFAEFAKFTESTDCKKVTELTESITSTDFKEPTKEISYTIFNELPSSAEIKIPPKQKLKGSVRAIDLQAQCPFKAFAEMRLKAKPLELPPQSLTKSERGEIVHEVLYRFWQITKSQSNLMLLTDEELQERLANAIHLVIAKWEKKFPKRLTPIYMSLERQRLKDLLLRFINLEKLRQPFEVVALELQTEYRLGSLDFSLRIDRIDKLEDGEELLIDYKTGQTQINSWMENPPLNPQLPLYCTARNPKPAGIALAVLRSNDLKYQGIAKDELSIDGIKPLKNIEPTDSWETLCDRWQSGLEKLSSDYAEGIATVKPKAGDKTCQQCNLQALCRIRDNVHKSNC